MTLSCGKYNTQGVAILCFAIALAGRIKELVLHKMKKLVAHLTSHVIHVKFLLIPLCALLLGTRSKLE